MSVCWLRASLGRTAASKREAREGRAQQIGEQQRQRQGMQKNNSFLVFLKQASGRPAKRDVHQQFGERAAKPQAVCPDIMGRQRRRHQAECAALDQTLCGNSTNGVTEALLTQATLTWPPHLWQGPAGYRHRRVCALPLEQPRCRRRRQARGLRRMARQQRGRALPWQPAAATAPSRLPPPQLPPLASSLASAAAPAPAAPASAHAPRAAAPPAAPAA